MKKGALRQNIAALSCSVGVGATATCYAWFAPLMLKMSSEDSPVKMTQSDTSWVVASMSFGLILFVLPVGLLADRYGRKTLVLSIGPLCSIGFLLISTTRSILLLYLARFLQGIASSVALTTCPIYIAEIAEPKIRGFLSFHVQTLWFAGVLFAYAVGPYVDYQSYADICQVLPIIFLTTFSFMPETPYYLLMKGREEEAKQALVWLRSSSSVEAELKTMMNIVQIESQTKGSWRALFQTKKDIMGFLLVQVVCLTKYMNGMTAIIAYASQTFGEASMNYLGHNELTILLGIILTLVTFLSSFMSDTVGRRPLLIISSGATAFFLAVLGVYYFIEFETSIDKSPFFWVSYAALTAYCTAANVGLGPLMQTIQAEFFPSNTRSIGGALTSIAAGVWVFLCIKQYQYVQDSYGVYLNYFIYAGVCGIGGIVLYIYLPETAGRSLGQIQDELRRMSEVRVNEDNNAPKY